MYAIDLAKYIVDKCISDRQPITNLQLQKILFDVQKDFLDRDKMAFYDDIEAWQFGPVVPSVYYYYCGNGASPIDIKLPTKEVIPPDISRINDIVETKRVLMPWDLVAETHKAGGAWDKVYNNGLGNRKVIPTKLIKELG